VVVALEQVTPASYAAFTARRRDHVEASKNALESVSASTKFG
jgi:hypothetical protein